MEYLVTANLRAEQAGALLEALETGRLAAGEVYENEMQRALGDALVEGEAVHWIENCYCSTPLKEERSILDVYFKEIETEPLVGEPPGSGVPLTEHLRSASSA